MFTDRMAINIGNNNKIQNTIIAEDSVIVQNSKDALTENHQKKSIVDKHPIICSLIVSFIVGFLLLFSFWREIVLWVESRF